MGVRVIIGSNERNLNNIESNWVTEQVNRRKKDGVPVCVKILISHDDINLALATSDCPSTPGRSRKLTGPEQEIVDLWHKLHLHESHFSAGNVVAFLKQLGV